MAEPSSSTQETTNDTTTEEQSHNSPRKVSQMSPNSALNCEMCQNYEINLTNMQDAERKLKEELKTLKFLTGRLESDLITEREYRREKEKEFTEAVAQTADTLSKAEKNNEVITRRLDEVTAIHRKSVEVFTEKINEVSEVMKEREKAYILLGSKYKKLLGTTKKNAEEMRSEVIDLPVEIDQLHFLCLKNREELIETKSAKEHNEQTMKDEIASLREQLNEEIGARNNLEVNLLGEINALQKDLGIANSKLSDADVAITMKESSQRQIHDLQTTVAELEAQVQQVQNERAAKEITAQNYKQRCSNLQQEMDNMEGVQRDFVQLSQSLQIQLEKIRQSEQEVRWQWDDEIDKCSNCETSVVKLKPKPHCLHCGKIFCVPCLKATVPSGLNHRPANVCQVCHTLLNRDSKPFFATQDH